MVDVSKPTYHMPQPPPELLEELQRPPAPAIPEDATDEQLVQYAGSVAESALVWVTRLEARVDALTAWITWNLKEEEK